jgi:hypothetical protein
MIGRLDQRVTLIGVTDMKFYQFVIVGLLGTMAMTASLGAANAAETTKAATTAAVTTAAAPAPTPVPAASGNVWTRADVNNMCSLRFTGKAKHIKKCIRSNSKRIGQPKTEADQRLIQTGKGAGGKTGAKAGGKGKGGKGGHGKKAKRAQ